MNYNLQQKKRIAKNFSNAAETYDIKSSLQNRVAKKLLSMLPESFVPLSILDIGSGTGSITKNIANHYNNSEIYGIDFAQGMVNFSSYSHPCVNWCVADAECLPFFSNSFNLIFSNLCIQWCSLKRTLREVFRVLDKKSVFVMSSLVKGTFYELDCIWRSVFSVSSINEFPSFEEQKEIIKQSDFKINAIQLINEQNGYESLIEIMKTLKSLGVNTTFSQNKGLISKEKFLNLNKFYERFRNKNSKLPLTYKVIYVVLYKE